MLYQVPAKDSTFRAQWEAARRRSAGLPPAPRVISGRSLVHCKLSPRQRAVIAAELLAGEAIIQLSVRQLSVLLEVSVPYIAVASKLTPAKRRQIAAGFDVPFAPPMSPALPAAQVIPIVA